jgi:hypothetical protein
MPDNEDVLLSLQFHDDGFKTNHYIPVRFPSSVTIIELVLISAFVVFWITFLFVSEAIEVYL